MEKKVFFIFFSVAAVAKPKQKNLGVFSSNSPTPARGDARAMLRRKKSPQPENFLF
jgi:hypothetical protein